MTVINKNSITAVCIDVFAIKKRESYGTIMIDINTHNIVDMIDSREYDKVKEWLLSYKNIKIVSRDGSIVYHNAIADSHPAAMQVSDRFHILKNLTSYASDYLKKELKHRISITVKEFETQGEDCIKNLNIIKLMRIVNLRYKKNIN